jgi:FdrA protein
MGNAVAAVVRRNTYVDSVSLLQLTSEVLTMAGVQDAALVMATELNREILREAGLLVREAETAGANDVVIAVRASDDTAVHAALEQAERLLSTRRSTGQVGADTAAPRSIRAAHRADPAARLAVISVPGAYAAGEARQALADGLNVFLFSDNVSIEDELDLKRRAQDRGLLVMGPDCGTAVLNGVGLGFANLVRRGGIGLIGASGTGLQEVACLLHQAGEGISHAIGTGSRDLSAEVRGISTLQALEMLRDDPSTQTIVLISKPSDPSVAQHVLAAAAKTRKPVVACLLGSRVDAVAGVQVAANLYQAARLAASPRSSWTSVAPDDLPRIRLREQQRQVRGLFCGGTLCQEARAAMAGPEPHQFIDFGEDEYTRGRAHPMIDPTLRNQAIVQGGRDAAVAVLLLDFILGLGAHPDPAGVTLPAIEDALASAAADGRELSVLAHIVGTDGDPQGLQRQASALRAAGVHLFGSNYHAAVAASLLLEGVAA